MAKLSVTVTLMSPVGVGAGGRIVGGRAGSYFSLPSMTAAYRLPSGPTSRLFTSR